MNKKFDIFQNYFLLRIKKYALTEEAETLIKKLFDESIKYTTEYINNNKNNDALIKQNEKQTSDYEFIDTYITTYNPDINPKINESWWIYDTEFSFNHAKILSFATGKPVLAKVIYCDTLNNIYGVKLKYNNPKQSVIKIPLKYFAYQKKQNMLSKYINNVFDAFNNKHAIFIITYLLSVIFSVAFALIFF